MRTTSQYYGKAIVSAFIASLVTALAYLTWRTMTPNPDVSMDTIYWMGAMLGRPGDHVIGWLMHFILGSVVFGALFAWVSPKMFGPLWLRGAIYGLVLWLLVMVVGLPMTEAGMFGKMYSPDLAIAFFVSKLVYGIVLGVIYSKLLIEQSKPADERIGASHEDRDSNQNHKV